MDHRLDGAAHKDGRVIDDAVVHAFGEAFFQLGHPCPHIVGNVDGVGAWALKNRHCHGRLVIEQRAQGVLTGTQLDTCDVFQAGNFSVWPGTDHHVFKLFLTDQAALGVDRHLKTGGIRRRRRAQLAGGDLTVLFANRVDHVGGGQVA